MKKRMKEVIDKIGPVKAWDNLVKGMTYMEPETDTSHQEWLKEEGLTYDEYVQEIEQTRTSLKELEASAYISGTQVIDPQKISAVMNEFEKRLRTNS